MTSVRLGVDAAHTINTSRVPKPEKPNMSDYGTITEASPSHANVYIANKVEYSVFDTGLPYAGSLSKFQSKSRNENF